MVETPKDPQGPKLKDKKSVDVATLNMGNWLFHRQNLFLTKAHEMAHEAADPAMSHLLLPCLSAFEHAFLQVAFEFQEKERKRLEQELLKVRKKVFENNDKFKYDPNNSGRRGLPEKDYRALHREVMGLFYKLYQAQYHVGLGVPKERYKGTKLKLKEAMER